MRIITAKNSKRRGVVIIYVTVSMMMFLAVVSLAVDVAHVRLVKVELQAAADAAALAGARQMTGGALAIGTAAYNAAYSNYANGSPVVLTVSDFTLGTWSTTTKSFTSSGVTWSASTNAVHVTARRTAATSNAVSLMFISAFGLKSEDVIASATAYVSPAQTSPLTIPSTSDPWLAGMPSGSTASYDDSAPAQSPMKVPLTLTPGSYIQLSNIAGYVNHGGGSNDYNADGDTSNIYTHGADSPGGATPAAENGISDIASPIDAIIGVFLNDNAPNLTTAPAKLDYSTAASRDLTSYADIQLQQVFFIGDGKTSTGTQQEFQVPPGATRLYVGPMDGHEWKNNNGAFTATVTASSVVELVQ